jgi:hypothetical protein
MHSIFKVMSFVFGGNNRVAYKPLVERYDIPRPTLIEWQKKSQENSSNWRTKHLQYLRDQLMVEKETIEEINQKGIHLDEAFLWLVFLFFEGIHRPLPKSDFASKLRRFSFVQDFGVEYQHPFAKRIWHEQEIDGITHRIAPYVSLVELSERLTAAQYYCFQSLLLKVLTQMRKKLNISSRPKISGSTWQELHTYDKVFKLSSIKQELEALGIQFND